MVKKNPCVFCGKPYELVDGKYRETVAKSGDYTIIHETNNHISIYKGDEFIFHAQYTKKLSKNELISYLTQTIRMIPAL